jgi:hypothetical protein
MKVDRCEITEISTLVPEEPPNISKVCCVIAACKWRESTCVVWSGFPFHKICDCETKPVPLTVNRTEEAFAGTISGHSEVIWG